MDGDFKRTDMPGPEPMGVLRPVAAWRNVWPNAWPSMIGFHYLLLQRRVDFTRFFIVPVECFGPLGRGAS